MESDTEHDYDRCENFKNTFRTPVLFLFSVHNIFFVHLLPFYPSEQSWSSKKALKSVLGHVVFTYNNKYGFGLGAICRPTKPFRR
jgi:hypothetical protein